MKKINAYTLMEVTVAMLLSAICITICYTAYGIINNYYRTFQQKNEKADQVLSLKHVLEKDFLKSNHIISNENGFEVEMDSLTIDYIFNGTAIVRKMNEQHADTFRLVPQELSMYFEGKPVLYADTIDRVDFKVSLTKGMTSMIQINKLYSAENLFK